MRELLSKIDQANSKLAEWEDEKRKIRFGKGYVQLLRVADFLEFDQHSNENVIPMADIIINEITRLRELGGEGKEVEENPMLVVQIRKLQENEELVIMADRELRAVKKEQHVSYPSDGQEVQIYKGVIIG